MARLPASLQENRQPKAVDYLQNTKDQKKKQIKKKKTDEPPLYLTAWLKRHKINMETNTRLSKRRGFILHFITNELKQLVPLRRIKTKTGVPLQSQPQACVYPHLTKWGQFSPGNTSRLLYRHCKANRGCRGVYQQTQKSQTQGSVSKQF